MNELELLEEILAVLKEIQKSLEKPDVNFTLNCTDSSDGMCNCVQSRQSNKDGTAYAWTCPVHGYQTC